MTTISISDSIFDGNNYDNSANLFYISIQGTPMKLSTMTVTNNIYKNLYKFEPYTEGGVYNFYYITLIETNCQYLNIKN